MQFFIPCQRHSWANIRNSVEHILAQRRKLATGPSTLMMRMTLGYLVPTTAIFRARNWQCCRVSIGADEGEQPSYPAGRVQFTVTSWVYPPTSRHLSWRLSHNHVCRRGVLYIFFCTKRGLHWL